MPLIFPGHVWVSEESGAMRKLVAAKRPNSDKGALNEASC